MKTQNLIFITLSLFLLSFSCGNKKELANKENTEIVKDEETKKEELITEKIPDAIIVSNWAEYRDGSPVNIENVNIDKDIIEIDINYSGGCAEHEFILIGQEAVMKSLPPQRVIKLFHKPVEDDCRELISQKLRFDISAFKFNANEIVLRLENFQGALVYHY